IGHQSLLFSLANSFTLAIAADRFYAAVLPLRYKQMVENTGSLSANQRSHKLFLCSMSNKLLFGAIVQSDRGSNDGPYFTILNTTSGLSNFVIYLICLKDQEKKEEGEKHAPHSGRNICVTGHLGRRTEL
uniref:Vomeronasal type-1 receptor n=1 Tax=Romanomermis culicivorax TaxID=13658 RepID=A0A915IEV1_ROMCU